MRNIKSYSLYLVASSEYADSAFGGQNVLEVASLAISGGADILQVREKNKSSADLIKLGRELSSLCKKKGVVFIVNDDPYLAGEVGADGVHLGQGDLKKYPVQKARDIIGKGRLIGISTHNMNQFKKAEKMDCDYIAFGPIFETPSKNYCIGTDDVEKVSASSAKPVVFIGGITLENIGLILAKGAKNIAVTRAIMRAGNALDAARALKAKIRGSG